MDWKNPTAVSRVRLGAQTQREDNWLSRIHHTSIDTARFLVLALWISSMKRLCMVVPLTETCGASVACVGWDPVVGSCTGAGGVAERWPPAGTPSLWLATVGEPWTWLTRADECWDWWMTTGELCTWWTVIVEKGMTSDLTDDTWDSDVIAARFCCACPWACLSSSWFFRASGAVAFSTAEHCTAWDGSTPFSSPSVTCLPAKLNIAARYMVSLQESHEQYFTINFWKGKAHISKPLKRVFFFLMLSVVWFYSFLSDSGTRSFKETTLIRIFLPFKMFANLHGCTGIFWPKQELKWVDLRWGMAINLMN